MDDLISREQALDAIHDWKPSDVFDEFNPTTAFTIICALPSANPDLSGFCDRLWRGAYDCGYERCKDDAVEAIEMLLEQSEDDEHDKTWNNAIRGAVNAVKHHTKFAQPEVRAQISSADCISRQDAIDVAKQHWYKPDIAKALEDLPSVQPERKKGEWKPIALTSYPAKYREMCSCCGFMKNKEAFRFCPICGAEMRGEEHV